MLPTRKNQRGFPQFIELSTDEGINGDQQLIGLLLKIANGEPDPGIRVSSFQLEFGM